MDELTLFRAFGSAVAEACACDATIVAASSRVHDVERAVKAHNRTRRHVAWRVRFLAETMGAPLAPPGESGGPTPPLVSWP